MIVAVAEHDRHCGGKREFYCRQCGELTCSCVDCSCWGGTEVDK